MPSVRFTNCTSHKLNISLKQLTALHFENEVEPGQTIKFKPGKVWFTLEALVDDGKNRYSLTKSAATIGIISLAVGVTAITAGAALLPEVAVLSALAAGTSSTITPALSKFALAAKSTVIAHSGVITKVTASAIPKAIAALSSSLGGMTALQAEVLSILSSPLTPSSLRARGMHILSGLRRAHAADKAKSQAEREEDERAALELEQQAQREEREGKDEKDATTGEIRSVGVTEGDGVRGRTYVRKHGVYIGERKHFEVRMQGASLGIYDPTTSAFHS